VVVFTRSRSDMIWYLGVRCGCYRMSDSQSRGLAGSTRQFHLHSTTLVKSFTLHTRVPISSTGIIRHRPDGSNAQLWHQILAVYTAEFLGRTCYYCMLECAIAVCLSVCHTCNLYLNGSSYRNMFHTVR